MSKKSQKQTSLKEEQVDELLEEIEGLDREFTQNGWNKNWEQLVGEYNVK